MNYYNEIENYVKKHGASKKYREIISNNEELETKWNIGRLIVEAQGGKERLKYGNKLINKWSISLTEKYGKGYDSSNLRRFRKFYILFEKCGTLSHELTWSHIQYILPLNNANERNYYINKIIQNNWSVRELRYAIKTKEFDRLLEKPDKVEIITKNKVTIASNFKNPIIITIPKDVKILKEKDLETSILANLRAFFTQLGSGFAFIDNQHPIFCDGKIQYIDMLLFNIEFNCYVVVELKIRELKPIDEGQIKGYMKAVDETLKKNFHNKTIGIIISKKNNIFEAKLVQDNNIYALTYEFERA